MKLCFLGDAGHINLISWIKQFATQPFLEIHVVTFNRPCEIPKGVHFHLVRNRSLFKKLRYITGIGQLNTTLREVEPDLLIAYRLTSYGLMAALSRFSPFVAVAQGSDIFVAENSIVMPKIARYVLKNADLVHCWAPHMGKQLERYGASKAKMFILPKGIDTAVFRPVKRKQQRLFPRLITTRQLRKSYNHAQILNSLPVVISKYPDLEYVICGEGEYQDQLIRDVKTFGIEKQVTFLGKVVHEDLPDNLSSADIYVAMQSSDGVSASLIEAMACGLFPIVSDIDANRFWIKDGINGFCVPLSDTAALSEKIMQAIENKMLRNTAREINLKLVGMNASVSANIRKTIDSYSRLLSNIPLNENQK